MMRRGLLRAVLGLPLMSGDGLVRGLGAPGTQQPVPGVQPGVSGAVITANRVIISGAGGGLYVYSGSPAAGNLIASVTAAGGLDPYKLNNCVAGVASYVPQGTHGTGYFASTQVGAAVEWFYNTTYAGTYFVYAAFNASLVNGAYNFLTLPVQSSAGTTANPTQISTDTLTAVPLDAGYTAGTPALSSKLLSEANTALLSGAVDGTFTGGFVNVATVAAAYRPAHTVIVAATDSLNAPIVGGVTSAGAVFCNPANGATSVNFNGTYPIDL